MARRRYVRVWEGAIAIRLGKDDVESNYRRAHLSHATDQTGDDVPGPRPLPDGRETLLVHVDDDDVATRRRGVDQSQYRVVNKCVKRCDGRWSRECERGGGKRRNDAAQ